MPDLLLKQGDGGSLMRKSLKRHLIPELARIGFSGGALHFQRLEPETQDLLSLQYWKYGGEFILEFARRPRGPFATSWGPIVPENKLDVAYINPLDRARLQQAGKSAGQHMRGFTYEIFGDDIAQYECLAKQVASLVPHIDDWLRHGNTSAHVQAVRSKD